MADVVCFACKTAIPVAVGSKVGRKEECPKCGADLHVCKNCRNYDRGSYNECREPQAERVQDKERSNFCDFFEPAGLSGSLGSTSAGSTYKPAVDLKAQAEALFKKK